MNEVVPGLFVGDLADAMDHAFDGERLCVVGDGNVRYDRMTHCIPVTYYKQGHWRAFASREALNRCADLISHRLDAGVPLLVHCISGAERAPLAVAWWLMRSGRYPTLAAAYGYLKSIRPVVEDRSYWIEPVEQKESAHS